MEKGAEGTHYNENNNKQGLVGSVVLKVFKKYAIHKIKGLFPQGLAILSAFQVKDRVSHSPYTEHLL